MEGVVLRFRSEDINRYREIFFDRVYEKFFSPSNGDVVLDIGANSGLYSLSIARKVGTEGKLYAVEPYSRTYELLRQNIAMNSHENIVTIRVALGSSRGDGELNVYGNSGCNSFYLNTNGGNLRKTERVKVSTLDSIVDEYSIKKLNMIKLDVEGHELEVLKGGKNSLRFFHPLIAAEIHDVGCTGAELKSFLQDFDYSVNLVPHQRASGMMYAS